MRNADKVNGMGFDGMHEKNNKMMWVCFFVFFFYLFFFSSKTNESEV